MGKIKTHKASAKRFSVTGTGKVKMNLITVINSA